MSIILVGMKLDLREDKGTLDSLRARKIKAVGVQGILSYLAMSLLAHNNN